MSAHVRRLLFPAAPGPTISSPQRRRTLTVGRRLRIGLLGLLAFAAAVLVGAASARAAGSGPVLVIVAHPDDEALGFAGVIESAGGGQVYVAVVTNGAYYAGSPPTQASVCGAADGTAAGDASTAITRDGETVSAMASLGVEWTADPATSHVFFLGYPDGGLTSIVAGGAPNDQSGLNHTYALDATTGTDPSSCNGDYHYLKDGSHADLTAANLTGDLAAVIAQVGPTDIYTHGMFDGHPDHAAVGRLVLAAVRASGAAIPVHSTLIHETGNGSCQAASAWWWPNPENTASSADRATPTEPFGPPALFATNDPALNDTGYPTCPDGSTPQDSVAVGHDWGPLGAPTETPAVPDPALKQQAIEQYASQLQCPDTASCGYAYAFVKSDEIFWTQTVSSTGAPVPVDWPRLGGSWNGTQLSLSVSWPSSAADAFLGGTSYSYQWERCDPASRWLCTAIPDATAETYDSQPADSGYSLRVAVTAHNDAGDSPAVYSGTTDALPSAPAAPANTAPPAISGDAIAGQTLTVQPGTWTGSPTPTVTHQWESSPTGTGDWTPLAGQTATTLDVTGALAGLYVQVVETATNSEGTVDQASAATAAVAVAPVNTTAPGISGTPTTGETLTVLPGVWDGTPAPTLTYRWESSADGSTDWTPIDGGTGTTLALAAGLADSYVRVVEIATNAGGSVEAAVDAGQVQAGSSGGGGSTGGGSTGGGSSGGGGSSSGGSTGGGSSGSAPSGGDTTGGGITAPAAPVALAANARVSVAADQTVAPALGGEIVYRIAVSAAAGYGALGGLQVDVTLPAGFAVASAVSDIGAGCTAAAPGLVCDLGSLAPGASAHLTIRGTVGADGAQALSAAVRHTGADANPADDTATLTLQQALTAPAVVKPSILLRGTKVATNGAVRLRVAIAGWTVNPKHRARAADGSGYWVILVDGKRNVLSRNKTAGVTKVLKPGRHTLRAELVREDGSTMKPRVRSLATKVVVPPRKPRIALVAATPTKNGAVKLKVRVSGWKINARHPAHPGAKSGYWVVYVDGRRNAVLRRATVGLTKKLAPGRHTIRLELMRENGKRLSPRALSARAKVTVTKRSVASHAGGRP